MFLKGCSLKCFWCQNPESQETKPEVLLNKSVCSLCGLCVDIGPIGANRLSEKGPIIDRKRCLGCGKCVEVCSSQGRTLVGTEMTVDEVMDEVLRDKAFYDNSEGGVTLSGGNPIMHPEFSLELLRKCEEQGLHTPIETCELTSWPILKGLLDHTDLILYDSKCLDAIKQRTWAQREGEDLTIEPMFCWALADRIEPVEISPKEHREAVHLIRQGMEQEDISFKGCLKKQKEGRKR